MDTFRAMCLAIILASYAGSIALGANMVSIESKQLPAGSSEALVGVYIANDMDLSGLVIPLRYVALDSNAYMSESWDLTVQGRLSAWAEPGASYTVSEFYTEKHYSAFDWRGVACEQDSTGLTWSTPSDTFDFVSPDASVLMIIGINPPVLEAGDDGIPGSGTPSIELIFGIGNVLGSMEIDTVCISPANRLAFVDEFYEPVQGVDFLKSTIEICCACDCHADPQCDGVYNVFDVVKISQVVNQGYPEPADPNPCCPYKKTDVDCDGDTDQTDLDKMGAVCFQYADPDTTFCRPCE